MLSLPAALPIYGRFGFERRADRAPLLAQRELGLEHLLHRRGRPHEQGARIRIEQQQIAFADLAPHVAHPAEHRSSEEHTSDLQSLMRISYAVFCFNKTKHRHVEQSNETT